jgi:hypothetical protein
MGCVVAVLTSALSSGLRRVAATPSDNGPALERQESNPTSVELRVVADKGKCLLLGPQD